MASGVKRASPLTATGIRATIDVMAVRRIGRKRTRPDSITASFTFMPLFHNTKETNWCLRDE